MQIVIHTSPRPLLTQILPTQHIITLTNQVWQIGLIQINICSSPNIINKTRIIITILHKVNRNIISPSHIVNHRSNIQLQIFLVITIEEKSKVTKNIEGMIESKE